MDTLFSLKVFVNVVEQGSFTKAAHQLAISVAMASKHLAHLERHVGAKLLHRNNRSLHLTDVGLEYYRQCCYVLETLENAAIRAAGGVEKPQGVLKMTMPLWFANPETTSWFAMYRHLYP